jgi:serine/threonine-protein kinase HipA
MDRDGNWFLAPAFDMTYNYQPNGQWTSSHQMTLNGKRDNFMLDDFIECGKSALLKRGQAKTIYNDVREIVSRWRNYADDAGVKAIQRDKIQNALRL